MAKLNGSVSSRHDASSRCGWRRHLLYQGAEKSLARPGRKLARATKIELSQATQKNSENCPSNHFSAAAMTSASDEKWRPFNCFFSPGRAKDLSAPHNTEWPQKHSLISSSYKIKTYWNILTKIGRYSCINSHSFMWYHTHSMCPPFVTQQTSMQ